MLVVPAYTTYVLSRNKKINVYPYKPQFYCIKVEFKGVKTMLKWFCLPFEKGSTQTQGPMGFIEFVSDSQALTDR